MGLVWNISRTEWVKAVGEASRGCQQSLLWLRSLLANAKAPSGSGFSPVVQQLLPCRCWKEKSERGGGWVSESPFRAAFVAVNGRARGILSPCSSEPLQMVAPAWTPCSNYLCQEQVLPFGGVWFPIYSFHLMVPCARGPSHENSS